MIIGLTGRAGSGKTEAQNIIAAEFDVEVLDLDAIGHVLLKEEAINQSLIAVFGDTILTDGNIDRKKLGKQVFEDAAALSLLNAVIHPQITEYVRLKLRNQSKTVIIVGALLKELQLEGECDKILVIDADDADILRHRPELSLILKHQRTRAEYQQHADIVILNTFSSQYKEKIKCILNKIIL